MDLLCVGHRGAMGHAPENTLASFACALELGAPCVELDVQAANGHLLVFHDERLERCTNGHGAFADASFETLRRLDAGRGERIPTLDEVVALVGRRAGVNIELKGAGTAALVADFVSRLRATGGPHDLMLASSFDAGRLRELRSLDRSLRLGLLCRRWSPTLLELALDLKAWSFHLGLSQATQSRVAEIKAAGLRCLVYTANSPADLRKLRELGVDGVFSDFPDRVLEGNRRLFEPGWL